jgi:hypothetical protein
MFSEPRYFEVEPSPLEFWKWPLFTRKANPFTADVLKGGATKFAGKYLPAGWRQYPAGICILTWIALAAFCYSEQPEFWRWLAAAFLLVVAMSPIYLIFIVLSYLLVRRNLDVLIDSNFVSVDGVGYSRQLPISFEVTEHELSLDPRRKFYRDAIKIVMHYGALPVVVAEMRGRNTLAALSVVNDFTLALIRTARVQPAGT